LFQVLAERYRQRYPLGSAYVSAYEARPTLNVRQERKRRFISLNFVEAVAQDGTPTTAELVSAYRVAGDGFPGKLKRLFLVLDDDEAAKKPGSAEAQKKKNKRHASGEGSSGASKKSLPATQ
jgi:hypothetical protein